MLKNKIQNWLNGELTALINLLDHTERADKRYWMIHGALTSFRQMDLIDRDDFLSYLRQLDKIHVGPIIPPK